MPARINFRRLECRCSYLWLARFDGGAVELCLDIEHLENGEMHFRAALLGGFRERGFKLTDVKERFLRRFWLQLLNLKRLGLSMKISRHLANVPSTCDCTVLSLPEKLHVHR